MLVLHEVFSTRLLVLPGSLTEDGKAVGVKEWDKALGAAATMNGDQQVAFTPHWPVQVQTSVPGSSWPDEF